MTAVALAPLIRRLTAPNPSVFTNTGTQTHIVGHGAVAVIDPGPDIAAHGEAILAACAGETIAAIVVTHTHRDHSPLAAWLQARTQAPVVGCAAIPGDQFDQSYAPDRVLADGEVLAGAGWSLEAVATPGHTSNHLCFACPEAGVLFSGDHVMGWSTSVVIPPDGDMGAYVASLERLLERPEALFHPAHGEPIERPHRLVRGMIGHRRQREGQVLRLLAEGATDVPALVTRMYVGLDLDLVRGAEASVTAHLLDLRARGRVVERDARWRLVG